MKKLLFLILLVSFVIGGYFFIFESPYVRCLDGIQAVVSARNPISGEIKQFNTPCHVPIAWQIIERN